MDSIGSEERILKGAGTGSAVFGSACPVPQTGVGAKKTERQSSTVKFSSIYPDSTVLGAREMRDGRDRREEQAEEAEVSGCEFRVFRGTPVNAELETRNGLPRCASRFTSQGVSRF